MLMSVTRARRIFAATTASLCAAAPVAADAQALASDWHKGFNNQARLIAGRGDMGSGGRLFAGLEIAMPDGWKTYWRTPGDAGGVPPEFDWTGSENLAEAKVLYPAPRRLTDKSGVVVGYAGSVIFPVELAAADASKPIRLRLKASYGVCKDLCVPAEADLTLDVPPDAGPANEIDAALAAVPRAPPRNGIDPKLAAWSIDRTSGKPRMVLEAAYPSQTAGDAFVEAPGGVYLPLPEPAGEKNGRAIFALDLSDVDLAALKGEALTVTLVGESGQSETKIVLD